LANKVLITPNQGRAGDEIAKTMAGQALANLRTQTEHATRLNNSFMLDGTEEMQAPLPLQPVPTADLPPASEHEGATLYDETLQRMVYSNGAAWVPAPTSAELIEIAQDAIGSILVDSDTIDFTYDDSTPSITAIVKADSIDASHIKANAIGTSELAATAVSAGSYTNSAITVDADGRITAAASDVAPGLVRVATGSAASVATFDVSLAAITSGPYSGFILEIWDCVPVTDGVTFSFQMSTDGGSSFNNTLYDYILIAENDAGVGTSAVGHSVASVNVTTTVGGALVGNGTNEGCDVTIKMMGNQLTTRWNRGTMVACHISNAATPNLVTQNGHFAREASSYEVDALRFQFNSGNVSRATWALYGIR